MSHLMRPCLQVRSLKDTLRAAYMQMERERAETRANLRVRTDRMKALKGELVSTVQVRSRKAEIGG